MNEYATTFLKFILGVISGYFLGWLILVWNRKRKWANKTWMEKYFENVDKTTDDLGN